MEGGLLDPKALGVHLIFLDVPLGHLFDGDPLFSGLFDQLVVDVGKVLHKGDLIPPVLQVTAQGVKDADGPGVSDMDVVVHGRAAGVDLHLSGLNGHKLFFLPCQGVVNLHDYLQKTPPSGVHLPANKKRPVPGSLPKQRRWGLAVPLWFFTPQAVVTGSHPAG